MAGTNGPDDAGKTGQSDTDKPAFNDDELERRRRQLDAALAERSPKEAKAGKASASSPAGFAMAMRLSTEFIGGILVGAAIGWLIDKLAGTTPWGMIVFLLLGFCAGILNVLRSAGLVAEQHTRRDGAETPEDK
ncbi:MAG: AtpZ/AtpI family protein [Rhizobiaceae bacterium]